MATWRAAKSINPDTRFTATEPQYLDANFNALSPNGGSFMGLDGDPAANGSLDQTVTGLTVGTTYDLSFYWAGIELFNRTGYQSIQLTGSLGGDAFFTPAYLNTAPAGTAWFVLGLVAREFHIHRECDERGAVLPGRRDARRQPAAVRPSGWRLADRRPRTVDLGDDARWIWRSRLCRLSPPPDGYRHRMKARGAIAAS